MLQGKYCRETIVAALLPRGYPLRGGYFERGKVALSCEGELFWEALKVPISARVIVSQKLPQDSQETRFVARHVLLIPK